MILIRDKTQDAQGFPLVKLLEAIILYLNVNPDYEFTVVKAWGRGIQICKIEQLLEERNELQVDLEFLLKLGRDSEEWFYDFECHDTKSGFRFGLIDSGALFIDGEIDIVKKISQVFENIEILEK